MTSPPAIANDSVPPFKPRTIRGGTLHRSVSLVHQTSSDGGGPTAVYIRDEAYAWLPAQIVSVTEAAGTKGDEAPRATVSVQLPSDWTQTTILSAESTIEELEDEQEDLGGGSNHGSNNNNGSASSALREVSLADYPNQELPLQNLSSGRQLMNLRDMADLPFLHEAAILYNLKERHKRGVPYTRVGDIVVAMNPFRWIHDLYSEEMQNFYANYLIWDAKAIEEEAEHEEYERSSGNDATTIKSHDPLSHGSMYDKLGFDPHVYESSSLAYRGLAMDGQDQTILVSGESGAGKTETVKIVMAHLATVEQTRPFFKYTSKQTGNTIGAAATVQRVLESNPVFEAFGNAKTLRNDNSSRFGKFTQLEFDVEDGASAKEAGREVPSCLLGGSSCTTYLLEKSRVVSHSQGERTYHIFYQLLAAPEDAKKDIWDQLEGTTNESFRYVGYTDTTAIEGHSDSDSWLRTQEALKVFTLEGDSLRTMMRALCAVLQLGNLVFDADPAADVEEGGTVITSVEELEKLSELVGIEYDELETAMTTRFMKTRYDEVVLHLRPEDAKDGCDALAKEIYARVFDVLVRKINEYTKAEKHYNFEAADYGRRHHDSTNPKKFGLISLLDIFGFERFEVNRFEQLCINYANERLQQKYVLDNFKAVKQEYEAEGIEIFDFGVVDNSEVLDLLEGRIGLIISLNEECIRPKGSDASFVYKVKVVHSTSPHLISEKLHLNTEFGVNHFAGPVTYDATKFVERNTDKLPQDLMSCACKSTNALIKDEFSSLASSMDKSRSAGVRLKSSMITNHTVLTKFRSQLSELMKNIENTRTRYIRCIRPNENMQPTKTDHFTTMRQLECAGLVTAITISRESFPNRLGYKATLERFRCLLEEDQEIPKSMDLKESVNYLLTTLLKPTGNYFDGTPVIPFACGKTRVYFRPGSLERLETDRMEFYTVRTIILQTWARCVFPKWKYTAFRHSVIILQSRCRGMSDWKNYSEKRGAVVMLQCWIRATRAMVEVKALREYNAAVRIQSRYRSAKAVSGLQKFKSAVAVIQRAARRKQNQSSMHARLADFVEEARMDNRLSNLQQQFLDEQQSVKEQGASEVDETLLEEIETMFDYLRKEIYALRQKNSQLRTELRDAEVDKRELLSHAESAEAAASLSRLRVSQLTKTNTALITEVMDHKEEISELRKDLRKKKNSQKEDLTELKMAFETTLEDRDNEIAILKEELQTARSSHKYEVEMLKDEMAKVEGDNVKEVLQLKDELRHTQDSHHDYLAKLMDVLETTHAARETETTRINAELNNVRSEKDAQIQELQREVEMLRNMHKNEASGLEGQLRKKAPEIANTRGELERNRATRSQRSQKFFEISERLERAVTSSADGASSKSSSVLGRKKKTASSAEGIIRMKKMIRAMRDLYELEETSHAKMDGDTMKTMEEFILVAEPSVAIQNLQDSVRNIELENQTLKKQLEEKQVCRTCEYRKQLQSRGTRRGFQAFSSDEQQSRVSRRGDSHAQQSRTSSQRSLLDAFAEERAANAANRGGF